MMKPIIQTALSGLFIINIAIGTNNVVQGKFALASSLYASAIILLVGLIWLLFEER